MIVMAMMRQLAPQHGLMFLIHEKPFAGINGSGKHNNWSMATDDGREPPRPGQRPPRERPVPGVPARRHPRRQRARGHPPREHRGRRPGPPPRAPTRRRRRSCRSSSASSSRTSSGSSRRARASGSKKGGSVTLGVTSLPDLAKDATDRNRTSPFAFTGNKFEFRAVGSSAPDLLAADRAQHGRRGLPQGPRGRARQAQAGRLRRADRDPVGHRPREQAGPVRGQRLLRGVARRGREAAGCRTTGRRWTRCRASRRRRRRSCSPSFGVLSERELTARAEINWERYVKVCNIEASSGPRHRQDDDPAGRGRVPRQLARRARQVARSTLSRDGRRATPTSSWTRIHGLEHAQHEAHAAGSSCRGEGLRRRRDPGPERAARDRRHAGDASSPTTSGRCRSTGSCCSSTRVLSSNAPAFGPGRSCVSAPVPLRRPRPRPAHYPRCYPPPDLRPPDRRRSSRRLWPRRSPPVIADGPSTASAIAAHRVGR